MCTFKNRHYPQDCSRQKGEGKAWVWGGAATVMSRSQGGFSEQLL